MDLYPHNLNAYNEAVERFKHTNRTCIIHPTGTGKSLIIAKFIAENPRKNHLLLAPSTYIFSELGKHVQSKYLHTSTLSNLLYNYDEIAAVGYDYIYLDEFHRIGAEQWGQGVKKLLEENHGAKVLGTSATPIRFLDDHRNMAVEIFNDNIASNISLNRAIADGILQLPKYVSAIYSILPELKKLALKIEKSDHADKNLLAEQLRSNVIDWENSQGLDAVIKKHLTKDRNRIIVFCRDKKHLNTTETLLAPVFKSIFEKIDFYHVYAGYTNKANSEALGSFSSHSNTAKILFTIDMLNEGLHVKNVNTAILLRETVSPTVFYQQIGRCFSVGQTEHPLIFDLVNNFRSIRIHEFENELRAEIQGNPNIKDLNGKRLRPEKIGIEFIDETKEIEELFRAFSNTIERWEIMFARAEKFYEKHGHLQPKQSEYDLNYWLTYQRQLYQKGVLSEVRKGLLEIIGMIWQVRDTVWTRSVEKLKKWKETHKELPTRDEDKHLYTFIANAKKRYKEGILSAEKINSLKGVLELEDTLEKAWQQRFENAKELSSTIDINNIPADHELFKWLKQQRNKNSKGELKKDRKRLLKSIGLSFEDKRQSQWNKTYLQLCAFVKKHNKLPSRKENKSLYIFVSHLKRKLKLNKLRPEQHEKAKKILDRPSISM